MKDFMHLLAAGINNKTLKNIKQDFVDVNVVQEEVKIPAGTYQLNNKTIQISPGVQLRIYKRKREAKNKSLEYLVCFINNRWHQYISGLFFVGNIGTTGTTRYKWDYQGNYYYLDIDTDGGKATISLRGGKSNYP